MEEQHKNIPAVSVKHFKKPTARVRVQQVFLDADLRYSMPGLVDVCKENGIDVSKRGYGELLVFLNSKRDHVKILACNGTLRPVVASYRMPEGRIYDLRVIGEIPKCFQASGEIDFDRALEKVLVKHLQGKKQRAVLEEE